MTSKRRTAQIAIIATGAGLMCSGILGALEIPTGINIAAALIITLALLVEAPLATMALARYNTKPNR
jgi:multisubunit Na+/H+ antiporter MnhF subunit